MSMRGRGALDNPSGRFETMTVDPDPEYAADTPLKTRYFRDHSRSVVTFNDSPDIGFGASLNPYRGCEHGCIYCYARPTHEYLGLSAGLDFESKIFVKTEAPALLRKTLQSPSWTPQPIALSGVTDPYQPVERRLRITRQCLAVLLDFRNPVGIITKNHLVTRDTDLLVGLAAFEAVGVLLSITTLDPDLAQRMEPRTASPALRLEAIAQLHEAGVPVGVMMGPIISGLTDHEIPQILQAAAEAGAQTAHYTLLRLPYGVKDLFQTWLEKHFPNRKEKVLSHIRDIRGGRLNDPRFGNRMHGEGPFAQTIHQLFALCRKRYGLDAPWALSTRAFRRMAAEEQLRLF